MVLIGDQGRFAVEYELDGNVSDQWMYGKCCYWCGGTRVGDYELGTSLRDVLFQIELMIGKDKRRMSQLFANKDYDAIFRMIDNSLFGGNQSISETIVMSEQWAQYIIYPQVDVFDDWKVFLLEEEGSSFLIYSRSPYIDINMISLPTGEVENVINEFRTQLLKIYNNLLDRRESGG